MFLHVLVNKLSPGSLLLFFAKVMLIKKSVKIRRYEFITVVWLHMLHDDDDDLLTETCRSLLM
jgi:hypothetical protein